MGHNLNFNAASGETAFMSVREKAWHGLGQILENYPTSAEAIKLAHLDYEVEKLPNIHRIGENDIVSTESFFTYRTDTNKILGPRVGADYQITQNVDAFNFFDAIVGGDGIQFETAGALGDGEKIFITAKLPNYIRVGKDDMIEKYLFLTNSHDSGSSITAAFTPVRIVCANTLNAAMNSRSKSIQIRHTGDMKTKMAQAHQIMQITNTMADQMEEIFNHWAKVRITDQQLRDLISAAMVDKKEQAEGDELSKAAQTKVDEVVEYAMTDESQLTDTTKGTLFGAYNAVTGYFQNVKDYKTPQTKLNSIFMGGTAQSRGQKAFDLAKGFAKFGVFLN